MDMVNYDKEFRVDSNPPAQPAAPPAVSEPNEFDKLQDRLDAADQGLIKTPRNLGSGEDKVAQVDGTSLLASMTKSQWAVLPNDTFTAIGATVSHLPPAIYTLSSDGAVIFFNKTKVLTDNLIELDDSAALKIIAGIERFWDSKDKFDSFGILFKRGILMWGPAGSGKTATVNMLMNDLVKRGGMVVIVQSPPCAIKGLHELRRIEPNRPIIVVLEDIEEMINNYGEHGLLGLLDGEHQVSNVVVLATTNYPELLGERIINRPSRFDEVILVDMPSAKARYRYLKHVLKETVSEVELAKWVAATDKLSIAHLRELIVATQCLGRPYSEVVERLKKMKIRPNSERRGKGELGFEVESDDPSICYSNTQCAASGG